MSMGRRVLSNVLHRVIDKTIELAINKIFPPLAIISTFKLFCWAVEFADPDL